MVLLFIIGPNIEIGGILLQDWIFLLFIIILYFNKYIQKSRSVNINVPFILLLPSLLIAISFVMKLLFYDLSFGDFGQFLKYLVLYFYAYMVLTVTQNETHLFVSELMDDTIKYVGIGVIYISLIAIAQLLFPSIIESFFTKFYLIELFDYYNPSQMLSNLSIVSNLMRVSSIFSTPMVFGGVIALLTLSIIVFRGPGGVINTTAIILGVFALLLSNTRSPIIGFVFGIFLFYRKRFRKNIFLILGVVSFVIIIFIVLLSDMAENINRIIEVFLYIGSGFDKSYIPANLDARFYDIDYVWFNFKSSQYILTGITKEYYNSFNSMAISLHNEFFSWIVQFGLAGFLLSFWPFYLLLFFNKITKNNNDEKVKKDFNGLKIIIASALLMSLSQPVLLSSRWREFLFLYMTLSYVYFRKNSIYNPLKSNNQAL